jgi:hypothetical protein
MQFLGNEKGRPIAERPFAVYSSPIPITTYLNGIFLQSFNPNYYGPGYGKEVG